MGNDLILVTGEALVDLIPLDGSRFEAVLGGSPFNTAIGLGRLRTPTGFAGRLSTDTMGEAMVEHLNASAVDLGFVVRSSQPSPLAFVTQGTAATGARYSFYLGSTAYDGASPLPERWPDHVGHLHIGSFSATEGHLGEAALAAFRLAKGLATTSYDPNIRPLVVEPPERTVRRVEDRVRLASVVKVSDEDLAWLYPGAEPQAIAAHWATLGPRLVVLTAGGAGATAFFDGRTVDHKAPAITVVDTVGAGDSFMAALLAVMHADGALGRKSLADLSAFPPDTVSQWVGFAIAAAAITCARKGANPPTLDEVRQVLPGSAPATAAGQ